MNAETLSAAPRPAASGYPIVLLLLCLLALLVLDSSLLSGGSPAHLPLRPLGSPGGGIVGGGTSLQPGLGKFAPLPGSDELSFNVIVTSTGRAELPVFMEALAPQLTSRDYITLISDKPSWHLHVAETFPHVRCNCTKLLIENAAPLGWWGHGSRNKWQRSLPGAFHLHADDDDLYAPDAFDIIRRHVVDLSPRVYIFRLVRRWDGEIGLIPPMSVTRPEQIVPGAVSTQNGVIRAVPELYLDWPYLYGGDGHFYKALVERFGYENVTLVPAVTYHFGQRENLLRFVPQLLAAEGVDLKLK